MTTKVTSDDFTGLVNPYTGEPMTVFMTVNPGSEPLFRCPDTYSTGDTFATKEECLENWNRVNGVSGLRSGKPVVCAYTGAVLSVVKTATGWKLSGGFNPKLFYRRDEFLRLATMRGGVSPVATGTPGRVTAVRRPPTVSADVRRSAEAKTASLDSEKMHELEGRVRQAGGRVGGGTVSMFAGRKRRRGK